MHQKAPSPHSCLCHLIAYLCNPADGSFVTLQAQEADTGGEPLEEGESRPEPEEGDKETPPYTLKCANHLGDVRLQNCPSHEEQKVLYFTAQWEHDGGGVYDVAKFTQPEVLLDARHKLVRFATACLPTCPASVTAQLDGISIMLYEGQLSHSTQFYLCA